MTKIFLHGLIGREFGKEWNISISNPKDVIHAIDSQEEGFRKRLLELSEKGMQYALVVDDQLVDEVSVLRKGKIKEIHIVPVIFGSGPAIFFAVGLLSLGSAAAVGTGTFIGSLLLSVGLSAISFGISSLLSKPPSQNAISNSATVSATTKSFLFTNKENIAAQGTPVPLGYGRLQIGSAIIQESIKSYPNSLSTFDEFASQSLQVGGNNMSIIHNQQLA